MGSAIRAARTIVQKIFEAHLRDEPFPGVKVLRLDRVFCHEISTPHAIEELRARGKDHVFDREKVKAVIDHVSPAKDRLTALQGKVLREWARRHQLTDFFDVGRGGVCHALFPEKGFIRPGFAVVMGDSHTCTLGAFGAFAAGIGTTDLEVAILKGLCVFREPKTLRVDLSGVLPPGVSAKDVILHVISRTGASGAIDHVMEFRGPIVAGFSMEARMTLCNMAVEAGATSGICLPDSRTIDYLWPFIRGEFPSKEAALEHYSQWNSDPDATYEEVLSVDVSRLEPLVTFGYKPDQVKPVREMAGTRVDQVYIGSCTNGRIEDLREAARLLRGRRIADSVRAIVSPATPQVYSQALNEGLIQIFLDAGCLVTHASCGPCPGMSGGILAEGEACAATTNRNFNGRMGRGGMIYLMSPATAAATALAGVISDPRKGVRE